MKRTRKARKVVTELPRNAMTVADYARHRNCTVPYIYELERKGKANFYIVIFHNINFVIPQ